MAAEIDTNHAQSRTRGTARTEAAALKRLFALNLDPDSLDNFDYELVKLAVPVVKALGKAYFRAEVRGIERVPEGSAMIVGNHNAGITFLEPFVMEAAWYEAKGESDPIYALAHDAIMAFPGLRNLLLRLGCVRANVHNSRRLLAAGKKLLVFPGGNYEAFRKYSERHTVDFGGHTGFARLALEHDTPIVPMLSVGGHETFFVLHRGERLAKLLRTDRLLRSRSFPIALGLPWGLLVGPIFHLPLPAKFCVELGEPFRPSDVTTKRTSMERRTEAVYRATIYRLQAMMDRVAVERRLPIVG